MEPTPPVAPPRDGLARIFKNLAWLIGGKGFGAVCSFAYLAILARTLSLKDFGHFSLVFGTAQALVAIAGFQTWQTVVRYGASSVLAEDWPRFRRLLWFCGSLDVVGAVVGCIIAGVVFYGFGQALGVNPKYDDVAFAFCCAIMWARTTTPNGVVRVLNRFDIGSYVEGIVPLGRLLGALVLVFVGATVERFLLVWALVDLLSGAVYWLAAYKLTPAGSPFFRSGQMRAIFRENPALGAFFGATYVASGLEAFQKQGPLLAVGYFLGTSAAGLFRFADQLAQGVGRLSQLVAPAVFSELSLAHSAREAKAFRKLVWNISLMTGLSGAALTILVLLIGRPALILIGGEAYAAAYPLLVLGTIAAALTLAGSSFEPVLLARGDTAQAMGIRAAGLIVLAVALAVFLPWQGTIGAAGAMLVASFFGYLLALVAVRRQAPS